MRKKNSGDQTMLVKPAGDWKVEVKPRKVQESEANKSHKSSSSSPSSQRCAK
jgi:hypothetical protein